ncbi:MAG: polymer-forming cytoskeletal protein [Patescibacteria group bacterium]|nr:polymer-forming cytoskeletal protein [Patescibacteria group bacterium]
MKKIFAFLIAFFVLIPTIVLAAEFKIPTETNTNAEVILGKNETAKNLYAAGGLINLDGKILSDLVAAGGTINLNSDVENDLAAVGGTLNIKGNIGKNARLAAGNIYVNGKIGEDLVVGGNLININKNAEITGDFIGAGSVVNTNGKVLGKSYISGNNITLNGELDGDVVIKNVNHLTLGNEAKINGKLSYSSPNEADISSRASVSGGVEFNKINESKYKWETLKITQVLYSILISFITIMVLISIFPKYARLAVESIPKNYWPKIGWGLFGLVVVPIATIFLFATMIGVKLAFIVILLFALLLLVASLVSPLILGSYLLKFLKKDKELVIDWRSVLIGVVALSVLGFIPIIGWIVIMLLFSLSFGLLGLSIWEFITKPQK